MSERSRVRAPYGTPVTLAQLVERKTFNLVVVGSSPACDTNAGLAQVAFGQTQTFHLWTWSERRTFNPEVRGSIPRVG